MPTTTKGLPYPAPTDAPNIPLHLQQLAEFLDPWLPKFVRLPAPYTHPVNNTTLADVPGFNLQLTPGTWSVDAHISMSPTTPAAGDAKAAWTFSGTASASNRFVQTLSLNTNSAVDSTMKSPVHAINSAVPFGADGSVATYAYDHLFLIVTATGVLQMQFAQNTANATASAITVATHFVAQRVA